MTWRLDLLGAADIMESRGQAKYTVMDDIGRVCLFGAINMAHHGDPDYADDAGAFGYEPHMRALQIVTGVRAVGRSIPNSLADWNNRVATQEQVVAALRAAAEVELPS